jgi:hypothetical protein
VISAPKCLSIIILIDTFVGRGCASFSPEKCAYKRCGNDVRNEFSHWGTQLA